MIIEPFDPVDRKGPMYRPDLCDHESDDGCMWCCSVCDADRHACRGCGTPIGHRDRACNDCEREYGNG